MLHSVMKRRGFEEQSTQESAEVKQSVELGVSSESIARDILRPNSPKFTVEAP